MFESNDEYDFNPTPSSKLASLFGTAMVSDNTNDSLIYTAPKQPKPKKEPEINDTVKNKPNSSVIFAKVINLWKLESKVEKQPLGKHGLAIIGSTLHNVHELILYKEKNNILIRVKLNEKFTWYEYPDSLGAFYDNQNQFWLTQFQNRDDEVSFLNEIKKYRCIVSNSDINKTKAEETPPSAEIDTSDSSNTQTKANILSRITKMGQQILPQPVIKNTSTELSDSEPEVPKSKPVTAPRKLKRNHHLDKVTVPQKSLEPAQNQIQLAANPQTHLIYTQPIPDHGLNNFILSQNVETKCSLIEINAKLDRLLNNNSQKQSVIGGDSNCEITVLKSQIKALRLKNENLLSELENSEKKYDDLLEQYNGKIDEADSVSEIKQVVMEKDELIDNQKAKIADLELLCNKNKDKITNLQCTINEINESVNDLNLRLQKSEKEKEKMANKQEKLMNSFNGAVKGHMNSMYQELMGAFDENQSYSVKQIQESLTRHLRTTTYKIMQDLGAVCESDI